ncbi:Ff.00g123260.m01.CDS01 [Fusarium sp. VM40]|uniref:Uncharacterized protein n=1 Tax=Fusarium avenaceum TaxID=40199 RepID=A0A9P7H5T0_9HYPO|nr:hypothetical protein KAF25_007410 [Fusarium avenaceum]KAH6963940.1 hypothetical protein DER45DRAFT_535158 [Fusarium avenaceum]KIL90778.1 hypothetical protein FAVG1_05473 [Fusarium avenaceum]CAJ0553814.1 Ff.00g123260.m01.CDS01 [Fusarium sp. VM40]
MPTAKPKLGKLTTPVTATFPSEITSATPISAVSFTFKPDPDFLKTPISPPMAYTDFLTKAMALNSPATSSGLTTPDSLPDTATSEETDASCKREGTPPSSASSITSKASARPTPPATAPMMPPSPFVCPTPMSAPPTGPACFPSLKVPPSPSVSNMDSPMSASTVRSPFSARPVHSVFDWDAALKARLMEKKQKTSRTSVRHIREVVTRTVTYTPRMAPAPKGKRRKVE